MRESSKLDILEAQFQSYPSIEGLLRYLSVETWERIKYCRNEQHIRVSEETITEDMVYRFRMMDHARILKMLIMQSTNERANGSDIEIIISTKEFEIRFPIQAKIIYTRSMKYEKMNHVVGEKMQIDLLLDYAKKVNGIPLYLLYNYSENPIINTRIENYWDMHISHFGCSFIHAGYVYSQFCSSNFGTSKKWRIPSFADLHGDYNACPFELMSKFSNKDYLPQFLKRSSGYFNFVDEPYEHFFLPPERGKGIGKIEVDKKQNSYSGMQFQNLPQFLPKYVITFYF